MRIRVSIHMPARHIVAGDVIDTDEADAKALIAQGFASEYHDPDPNAGPVGGAHVAAPETKLVSPPPIIANVPSVQAMPAPAEPPLRNPVEVPVAPVGGETAPRVLPVDAGPSVTVASSAEAAAEHAATVGAKVEPVPHAADPTVDPADPAPLAPPRE